MIWTRLHHDGQCQRTEAPRRVHPQPEGVQWQLWECPQCGAVATTPQHADENPHGRREGRGR